MISETSDVAVALAGWILLFGAFHVLVPLALPVPDKIRGEKDRVQREVQWREYVSCFPALPHAFGFVFVSFWIFFSGPERWDHPNSEQEESLMLFSIGYFVVDTCFGYVHNYNGTDLLIHHILAMALLVSTIWNGVCGFTVLMSFGIGEISNPFNLIRIISERNSSLSDVAYYSALVFAAIFLFARVFVATFYAWRIFELDFTLSIRVILAASCQLIRVPLAHLGLLHPPPRNQNSATGALTSATIGLFWHPSITC